MCIFRKLLCSATVIYFFLELDYFNWLVVFYIDFEYTFTGQSYIFRMSIYATF